MARLRAPVTYSDSQPLMMTTLKQFIYLVRPFWGRRISLSCWFLLALSLGLTLSSVWFNIKMNQWNGGFYNALQTRDGPALYTLLQSFVLLVSGLILVVVLGAYFQKKLVMRWREEMTKEVVGRWLSDDSRHYQLAVLSQEPDNPDQRIAEDIQLLVESTLRLLTSFTHATLTLLSFTAILWGLSGGISFSLWGESWQIPGYMFWACLVYTLLGIVLTQWIGAPLHQLNMARQRYEANYRTALIIRRQHGDAIAGQRGENSDRHTLIQHFSKVTKNWYQLIRYERNLSFYTVGYQQVTALAPILFALPKFLAGELTLGALMQLRQAFTRVATSLGWFIFAYKEIAEWQATVTRLYRFVILLDNDAPLTANESGDSAPGLDARLELLTPEGTTLLTQVHLRVQRGERVLLTGRSGLGKSTLLRALSGHWPFYTGMIRHDEQICWLPQNMYLPYGRLDTLLAYPNARYRFSLAQYREVLTLTGLEKLSPRLTQETLWGQILSGGEQQRLLFARLLLNQPRLLLLDEITSALDEESARSLITLLKVRLPNSAIVLVSHQRGLQQEVDRTLDLTCYSPLRQNAVLPEGTCHVS